MSSAIEGVLAIVPQEGPARAMRISGVRAVQPAARRTSDVLRHHLLEHISVTVCVGRSSKMVVRRSRGRRGLQGRIRVATDLGTLAISTFRDSSETVVNMKCTFRRSSAGRFNRWRLCNAIWLNSSCSLTLEANVSNTAGVFWHHYEGRRGLDDPPLLRSLRV